MLKSPPTRATILAAIKAGPAAFYDLAGPVATQRRKKVRAIVDRLIAQGVIRQVRIDRRPMLVLANWAMPDAMRLSIIEGHCRPVAGCMVWTGYNDAKSGPTVHFPDGERQLVRRLVWTIKRGPLPHAAIVQMRPACDAHCVEYTHMERTGRRALHAGKRKTVVHVQRITAAHRARAKLDLDAVRDIRASSDTAEQLAQRHGVSTSTVKKVRAHEIWREDMGLFTGLLRRAA